MKWVYVEDKYGRLIAKIYETREAVTSACKCGGARVVSTRQESAHCCTLRVYK